MIAEYVESILRKGIQRYAKLHNSDVTEVQLLIANDGAASPIYAILRQNAPSEKITFNQFLGIHLDLLRREQIVAPVLMQTFQRYSEEQQCPKAKLFILVALLPQEEDDDFVCLHLFQGKEAVKKVQLEEIIMN